MPLTVKASYSPSPGPDQVLPPAGTSSDQFCPSVLGGLRLLGGLASLERAGCCPLSHVDASLVRSPDAFMISFDPERSSCNPHYTHENTEDHRGKVFIPEVTQPVNGLRLEPRLL